MERKKAVPTTPDDMQSWSELIGGFMAGVFGLRGLQVIRARKDDTSLEDLIFAVQKDGEETRKILTAMRTDLAIILDREDRR